MQPIREVIEPIVARASAAAAEFMRKPVSAHPRFARYVEELCEPVPEQTILTAYEDVLFAQTGASMHTIQTLGRVAAEISINARATA